MGKRRSRPPPVVEEDQEEEDDEEEAEQVEEEEENYNPEEEMGDGKGGEDQQEKISRATEGDGEAEGGEDDENNDYQLQFETGMDPLAFAEEDESGVAPFQQFERLEYEVLAARKRKALALKKGNSKATTSKNTQQQNELFGAGVEEIWDSAGMGLGGGRGRGGGRRRKRRKKLGRPKGSTLTPETRKKLGEANVLYAIGKFDEAVEVLKEVVRLAPNVPDSYHTLGLLYDAMGDRKKALNFYMIAAHLTSKDTALWKRLASWSMEQGNVGQVIYCLTKAIKADPEDVDAKWDRASLYAERNEYGKAAEAFEQILQQRSSDVEVCKMVAKMYHKTGQHDRATQVLEKLIEEHPSEADLTAVNLLAELHMEKGAFATAIAHIDHARTVYCSDLGLPLDLAIKAGICHAYLGNLEDAESYFEELPEELVDGCGDLVMDVGDVFLALGEYEHALRYYRMLQGDKTVDNASLNLKMAQCHAASHSATVAIELYHKVLEELPEHVEARVALASLLVENGDHPAAVAVLSPPESSATPGELQGSDEGQQWWQDGIVRKKLAELHYSKGEFHLYLDAILPAIQETLYSKHYNPKGRSSKRLSKSVLVERSKWLEERAPNEVFHGFRPVLSSADTVKAARAKRTLARLTAEKEEKKAAALAAGLEYDSKEESEEDPAAHNPELTVDPELNLKQPPPLPDLLKDEEHYQLLLQCCKTLAALRRPWEALEIIQHVLHARDGLTKEQRDELRALGAKISFETKDVKYGFNCVRHSVLQRPYSTSAWNRYYQIISRSEVKVHKHNKFLLQMRKKYPDCTASMMICGHQFNMINQQQGAIREYLQAYKLQPEDPFINLCVGTAFINLSLGFRLNNRNQCIMQGFAFLYKYQRLISYNQESNYNLARAYHHVGLLQLAVNYYEKVLNHYEKDHPIVQPSNETADILLATAVKTVPTGIDTGHCNLQREAAYNLHLIYKKSGAFDLARQVLKDHCRF
ncbi:unnamed protein product [Calypogeia fissa]